MDSADIESFAVDKLRECFRRCENLGSNYMHIGDKEPSWDGFVYLYNSSIHSKANIINRLPVQIKGTEQNDLSKTTISFNVEKSDLTNYFNDGGALFFVVYIKDFDNYKIYYETLTKIKLHMYLKECEKHGFESISIHLIEMQKDNIPEVKDIFTNFSKDYNQVLPKGDFDSASILKNGIKGYKSFRVSYFGSAYKNNPTSYFMTHSTTIYAESEGEGPDVAIAIGLLASCIQKQNLAISINNIKYYDSYKTEMYVSEGKLYFGESFVFTFNKENNSLNFRWKIRGNLSQRIIDTEFLLAFLEHKEFSVDNRIMKFPISNCSINKDDIEYYEGNLRFLKAIKELFDFFGVKKELDYDSVTEKEEETLLFLIDNVLNHKQYKSEQKEPIVFQSVKIANIIFLIEIVRVSETECEIKNFFKESFELLYILRDDKTISFSASQVFFLQKEQFQTLSNIDYSKIFESLKTTPLTEYFISYLIRYTQTMLCAYDRQKEKDTELLDCVVNIYNFLLTKESDNECYILNRFQALRRKSDLLDEDKNLLLQIADKTTCNQNKIDAYLLYGDNRQAKLYYDKLSIEERKSYDLDSVNYFWKVNEKR